ncbi:NYN domain-containing protein [Actinophytocola sp.]|uniref:NYN domain-containing protein n=1 Tax=Actinophytocola sp. TaxID=1872138 RepID=UPI00389B231E
MPLLPAVLRDWRGFFVGVGMSGPQLCVVIDYQNIHLTAHDTFAPDGTPVYHCLVHPLKFAESVVQVRAQRQRDDRQKQAELASVHVFRGQPSNHREPFLYGITQRQRSEWTRDRRVEVVYRTLRYPWKWPAEKAEEKGIDVLVALSVVRLAASGQYDVIVLASHDTDLEPALELVVDNGHSKIETAGWEGNRILRPHGRRLWHTALNGADFVRSRDRQNYAPGR